MVQMQTGETVKHKHGRREASVTNLEPTACGRVSFRYCNTTLHS